MALYCLRVSTSSSRLSHVAARSTSLGPNLHLRWALVLLDLVYKSHSARSSFQITTAQTAWPHVETLMPLVALLSFGDHFL